jgi:transcriptional regulator with XRE-family HTH domain
MPMRSLRAHTAHVGRQRADALRMRLGHELRLMRMAAGLRQTQVAMRASLSQTTVSQMERGADAFSLDAYARVAASVGCELGLKLFPVASVTLRDRGQLELAQSIARAADASWRCEIEAAVAPGDRRAADLLLAGPAEIAMIEIFRSLADLQAQVRPAQLKREILANRHERPVRLLIGVPDGAASRRQIRSLDHLLDRVFPVSSPNLWLSIRRGTPIGGDGILFIRPGRIRADRTSANRSAHAARSA